MLCTVIFEPTEGAPRSSVAKAGELSVRPMAERWKLIFESPPDPLHYFYYEISVGCGFPASDFRPLTTDH
jgi:hypothetical protein